MNKLSKVYLAVLTTSSLGFSASSDSGMGGLCSVLEKIEGFAPVAVKIFAFIILIVGLGAGAFMIIDRERGMMGRGIVVAGIAVVFFALLWSLASPLQGVVSAGRSALGCGG